MSKTTTEYQLGFYQNNIDVRDIALRHRRAQKVAALLRKYAPLPLETQVCADLGCASGVITADIAPLFALTLGLEYDSAALLDADLGKDRLHFVRGDAMYLPLADRSVDVIVCNQVYEHVPDMDRMFSEMFRVLSNRGCVLLSGPNWLYPIEPHYKLPFLHWLPRRVANWLLRATHKGDKYYEHLQPRWSLAARLGMFSITDAIQDAAIASLRTRHGRALASKLPKKVWGMLSWITPTHNWILTKESKNATSDWSGD